MNRYVSFITGLILVWLAGIAGVRAELNVHLEYHKYELDNGMRVILHPDKKVPLIAVSLWYRVGATCEAPGRSGFAHLFEHMMFQGSKHVPEDSFFAILKKAGADEVNGGTTVDRTMYYEVVPRHYIETALWLESDRMGYLLDSVNRASFENQRKVVLNERRERYENAPYGQHYFVMTENLYPEGHAARYFVIGKTEDLEKATLDDVHGFFKKWYTPSNSTLVLAGDFEIPEAKAWVLKWFGSFPALPRPACNPPRPVLEKTKKVEMEDKFAKYPLVHYIWPTPERFSTAECPLDALATALGAHGWGRLYRRLVLEKHQARTVAVYNISYKHFGEFHIELYLHPNVDVTDVQKTLEEEIQRVIKEPLHPMEVKRHVVAQTLRAVWESEELLSRAHVLQDCDYYTGEPDCLNTYLERIRKLTTLGIQKAAQEWLGAPRVEILVRPMGGAK